MLLLPTIVDKKVLVEVSNRSVLVEEAVDNFQEREATHRRVRDPLISFRRYTFKQHAENTHAYQQICM